MFASAPLPPPPSMFNLPSAQKQSKLSFWNGAIACRVIEQMRVLFKIFLFEGPETWKHFTKYISFGKIQVCRILRLWFVPLLGADLRLSFASSTLTLAAENDATQTDRMTSTKLDDCFVIVLGVINIHLSQYGLHINYFLYLPQTVEDLSTT